MLSIWIYFKNSVLHISKCARGSSKSPSALALHMVTICDCNSSQSRSHSPPAWRSCSFSTLQLVIARQQWGHGGIWLACVLILLDHRKKHVVLSNVQALLDCDYTVLKCFFSPGTLSFFLFVYFSLLMNPDGLSLFQFAAPLHKHLP